MNKIEYISQKRDFKVFSRIQEFRKLFNQISNSIENLKILLNLFKQLFFYKLNSSKKKRKKKPFNKIK